jgi:predicted ATPase
MKTIEKIYVTDQLIHIDLHSYALNEAIEMLSNLSKIYTENGYKNLRLDMILLRYEDVERLYLLGDRIETDKEYNKRLKMLNEEMSKKKADKKIAEEKERAEYERLKKKFER